MTDHSESVMTDTQNLSQSQRMTRILWKLELLAHGPCQAYNPSGSSTGEPDDKIVAIVARGDDPEHIMFRLRYNGARTDQSREAVICEAESTYRAMVKRQEPAPPTADFTFEKMVLVDGKGWDAKVFANHKRVLERTVREIRKDAGYDPDNGEPLALELKVKGASRVELARILEGQGLSQAEIADRMGVSQPTVSRLLNTRRIETRCRASRSRSTAPGHQERGSDA